MVQIIQHSSWNNTPVRKLMALHNTLYTTARFTSRTNHQYQMVSTITTNTSPMATANIHPSSPLNRGARGVSLNHRFNGTFVSVFTTTDDHNTFRLVSPSSHSTTSSIRMVGSNVDSKLHIIIIQRHIVASK